MNKPIEGHVVGVRHTGRTILDENIVEVTVQVTVEDDELIGFTLGQVCAIDLEDFGGD